ncbi:hypothetical protein EC991_006845 [Linnemannia zychae]|nr:hypothetical protein EC991_006845 [Linnemannia zychae]
MSQDLSWAKVTTARTKILIGELEASLFSQASSGPDTLFDSPGIWATQPSLFITINNGNVLVKELNPNYYKLRACRDNTFQFGGVCAGSADFLKRRCNFGTYMDLSEKTALNATHDARSLLVLRPTVASLVTCLSALSSPFPRL